MTLFDPRNFFRNLFERSEELNLLFDYRNLLKL